MGKFTYNNWCISITSYAFICILAGYGLKAFWNSGTIVLFMESMVYQSPDDDALKLLNFDLVNDSQSLPDMKSEEFNNFVSFESYLTCDEMLSKGSSETEVSNLIDNLPDQYDGTTTTTLYPISLKLILLSWNGTDN